MVHKASKHIAPAKKQDASNYDKITFIILSAAVGKRMKMHGPKALLPYKDNITILDRQIETIYNLYPNADILLVVGFEHEKFIKYKTKYNSIRLLYNAQHAVTNTLYSTQLGLYASIGQKAVVLHGDLLFSPDAIKGLTSGGSCITVCSTINNDSIGVISNNNIATNIAYGVETRWGQITYFTDIEYQLLLKLIHSDKDYKRLFLYEGIKYIIDKGGKFRIHTPIGYKIYDIDSYKDLENVKGLL